MALDKITLHGIEDNAVTSAKIGVDVIVADDIAANAITVAELQDGAVSTTKIADLGVTHAKLHNTMDLSGKTVTLPSLSNLDVTTGTANVTIAGDLQVGGSSAVSSARIASTINAGNSLEWGHGNASGYRSTLGALSGGGQPFIAFSAEHGTNANTFRTRGLKGHAMGTFDNAGGMAFKAIQSANADNQANFIETMKISNEGYVTTPNQPVFDMFTTTNGGLQPANSDVILNGGYNGGNHVNTSTGIFTAPVAGRYIFQAWSIKNNANGTVARLQILRNGVVKGEARMDESGNYTQAHCTVIENLAANDQIKFRNNDSTIFYMGGYYGSCSGYLIG